MSRYANIPLKIVDGVSVEISEETSIVKVKGPKGELSFKYLPVILVSQETDVVKVSLKEQDKKNNSFVGLSFRVIQNMMIGVSSGFSKVLEFNGVGYRMAVKGDVLNMSLGFSHEINYPIPPGVKMEVKGQTLVVEGIDKEFVGRVADEVKSYKPVEPYKGKGIRYQGQYVIRKAGKSAKK